MLKRNNHHGAPQPTLMHYEVAGVPMTLCADGSVWLGAQKLEQQTAFALAVAFSLPGVKTTINRIERTRQAALALDDEE